MVDARSSAAAAASPGSGGGGGSDGGGGRGGGGVGRGKAGSDPKEAAAAAPAGRSSGPSEVNVTGKPLLRQERQPWAKMLSQHWEATIRLVLLGASRRFFICISGTLVARAVTPHVTLTDNEISIGRGDNCHIYLDDQAVSRNLCMLRHLEQRRPCELEVTGKNGRVVVNGVDILRGDKVPLNGGDEVVFGRSGQHAYHPIRDTKVTKAALISVDTGPTRLASEPINLEGPLVVPTTSGENNQRVAESALENQSDFRCPNASVTLPLNRWQTFKDVLRQGIRNPKDIDVTLDNFPYYLSEITKKILLHSAFVHMEKKISKSLQKISSLNQRILLSGPSGSEIYLETLIMALAKQFDARLLILDSLALCSTPSKCKESIKGARQEDTPSISGPCVVGTSNRNFFKKGDRVEYIGNNSLKLTTRGPVYGSRGKVVAFGAFGKNLCSIRFENPITGGHNLGAAELRPDSSGGEEVDNVALVKLLEVISEESSSNLIVLLKDVEKLFIKCSESYASLRNELPPGVLIIGSHTQAENHKDQPYPEGFNILRRNPAENLESRLHKINRCATMSMEHLNILFPNNICIKLPQNEAQLSDLKKQLDCDTETLTSKANVLNIQKFLTSREFECNDLQELSIKDELLTDENVDKIVGFAISHHLQHNEFPNNGKSVLPIESLKHGFNMLQKTHSKNKGLKTALKDVVTENEFEEQLLSNVISPNETGVTFGDIGALDNVKETLMELVMLPLQRPELFSKGQLRKPVKGILLFGSPGTGKTMVAKAVATEAGANFINVSMSSITSKWHGEPEKYVKAIFSLASKISPAVIFVDEVDSFLGKRERQGEHEVMRRMKNEFMVNWDGLRTKEQERVIVLGATNRPYDLDDAVIRRFPRRIMVSLPDASNREKILRVILSKETLAPEVDLKSIANMTEGYSGSDLNNLCTTAAQCPVSKIIEKEKKEKSLAIVEGRPEPLLHGAKDALPLGMDDLRFAIGKVCASLPPDSVTMNQLVEWNNQFGDGGSRKKQTLSYYI
ncbi:hypothetical protein U9M48_036921 [Paspalum notatum var. saurae]|uniref:FHA domain-containing protein n=1 Tax=Paspalum notatum var. saurae TaxID=547442 RepID=A0AAQ3X8Q9_PASNO